MDGDRATHVLIPIEEYEELVKADMIDSAVRKVGAKNTKWVDADDLGLELAAERIAQARKAAGLTQAQLGKKLGLPQSQISRIERNPDHTTVRTLKRIAGALNVDVSALVG
jgi:ribosome-binding protein aMBF1 (putative translation factor)